MTLLSLTLPPVLSVADAQILSSKCDATIIVVSSGITDKGDGVKAKQATPSFKRKYSWGNSE